MSRRTMSAMVAILVMATLVAACGPAPTPQVVKETVVVEKPVEVTKEVVVTAVPEPVAEGETILIGGFGPLSAPGSYQAGTEMRQAAEMAVDELNEAGGVLGKQIELIFGDTEGLPERGTAVTERLISQNHVVGLVGEYHSGVGLASMEVAHKYGIPVIFSEPRRCQMMISESSKNLFMDESLYPSLVGLPLFSHVLLHVLAGLQFGVIPICPNPFGLVQRL